MICSGRSTERCTWLGTAICLMPRYQLPDGEHVIGDNTRKYLALLKPEKQKAALFGMRAFWGAT